MYTGVCVCARVVGHWDKLALLGTVWCSQVVMVKFTSGDGSLSGHKLKLNYLILIFAGGRVHFLSVANPEMKVNFQTSSCPM